MEEGNRGETQQLKSEDKPPLQASPGMPPIHTFTHVDN